MDISKREGRIYVLLTEERTLHARHLQIQRIKKNLADGFVVFIDGICALTLREDENGIRKIHFTLSPCLAELEKPHRLTAKRTKCVHRLTADDIPPGIDPDDVMLHCDNDSECPKKQGGTK